VRRHGICGDDPAAFTELVGTVKSVVSSEYVVEDTG
jgi:hypothetical protein